jgi:hypothetical protein
MQRREKRQVVWWDVMSDGWVVYAWLALPPGFHRARSANILPTTLTRRRVCPCSWPTQGEPSPSKSCMMMRLLELPTVTRFLTKLESEQKS